MFPSLLVLSHAIGILWADRGGWIPECATSVGLFAAIFVAGRLAAKLWLARRGDVRPSGENRAVRAFAAITLVALLFLTGFERLDQNLSRAHSDRVHAETSVGEEVRRVEARIRRRRSSRWGSAIELDRVRAIDDGSPVPERLLLRLDDRRSASSTESESSRADRLLWPGRRVRLGLRVGALHASRNPGTPDREHQHSRRAFGARAGLVKPNWVVAVGVETLPWSGPLSWASAARFSWRQRVAQRFDEMHLSTGLVRAFALGDRRGLAPETRAGFRRLGLSHLLAISGLHIGFVAGLAGWIGLRSIVWLFPSARRLPIFDWSLALACAAAALYGWASQAGISVERASLLFGLFAVGRLALHRIEPFRALAWVALAILLSDPAALFDLGAQLSFVACAGLIAAGFWRSEGTGERLEFAAGSGFEPPDEDTRWRQVLGTMAATFRASLVVSIATAPLLAQSGLPLSWLSPLLNVIAIPWTGLFVLPTSLAAVWLLERVPDFVLYALTVPAGMLEAGVLVLAERLPQPSGPGVATMPVFVSAVALAFVAVRQGWWRMAISGWLALSLGGASPYLREPIMAPPPRVIFFDVGQGDAALVQGREAVMLIDTGPGPADGSGGQNLERALRAVGVQRVDVLVLSHGDLDHRAGLRRVLETFDVAELWLPGSGQGDEALSRAATLAAASGTRIHWRSASALGSPRRFLLGDLEGEILWPIGTRAEAGSSRNDNSMVLRVRLGGRVFLFVADIGAQVERRLLETAESRLSADVLKVAHHGSRKSSSPEFLARVSPAVAVLSAPCEAARGLPNGLAIERIRSSGASLHWTGRDGALFVSPGEERGVVVERWGEQRDCHAR